MPYRFKHTETFQNGLQRIIKEQVERTRLALHDEPNQVLAIHNARKAMKRIRALLRLVRPSLEKSVFRSENMRYRNIARALSTARDQHVMLQTLAELETQHDSDAAAGLWIIRNRVAASIFTQEPQSIAVDFEGVFAELDLGDQAASDLQLVTNGFDAVGQGLEKAYRDGRKVYCKIFKNFDDEAFHEWRKIVQLHWRHMSLLREAWPEICADRITTAKILSEALGVHNDLSVLEAYVSDLSSADLSKKKVTPVLRLIGEEKQRQIENARPAAEELYSEKPKVLRKNFETFWYAAAKSRKKRQEIQN